MHRVLVTGNLLLALASGGCGLFGSDDDDDTECCVSWNEGGPNTIDASPDAPLASFNDGGIADAGSIDASTTDAPAK